MEALEDLRQYLSDNLPRLSSVRPVIDEVGVPFPIVLLSILIGGAATMAVAMWVAGTLPGVSKPEVVGKYATFEGRLAEAQRQRKVLEARGIKYIDDEDPMVIPKEAKKTK